MIRLNRTTIAIILFLGLLLMNVAILIAPYHAIFSIFSITLLSTIPGVIILFALRTKKISFWMHIILTVGLSISFIMFVGLIFNWLWYEIFETPPLIKPLLMSAYSFVLVSLIGIGYYLNKEFTLEIKYHKFYLSKILLFTIPVLLCLMSIMGAFVLNNNGPNYLTLLVIFLTAIYMLLLVFLNKRVDKHIYPYSIFFISLSLLFMLSLRSWYLSGWDIQDEHRLFLLTKDFGYWKPTSSGHDYYACLSITLLPTIYNVLTNLSPEFLFKVVYQVFFSIVPLSVFFIAKRYTNLTLSFLASLYMFMQPFFIQPLVALMRQEIAFVFFALMILTMFEGGISKKTRMFIAIVFGCSMIVSHYSTTYLALILLLLTYIFVSLYRLLRRVKQLQKIATKLKFKNPLQKSHSYFISPAIILILYSFAIFWFSIVNDNASHLGHVAQNTVNDIQDMFKSEVKNEEAQKAVELLPEKRTNLREELNIYQEDKINEYRFDLNQRYKVTEDNNFVIQPAYSPQIFPIIPYQYGQYINLFFQLLKQLLKLFVLLGAFLIFFTKFKNPLYHREYILLAVLSAMFITLMLVHPSLSSQYNLSRFYLQTLIVLALPAVIGGMFFFSLLKKYALYATGFSFILLFVYFTGFINNFIGGELYMQLRNGGVDYNKFYVHKEEVVSGDWLNTNMEKGVRVFADNNAHLRLRYTSWLEADHTILPQIIYKESYVYTSYNNVVNNSTFAYHDGNVLNYIFPKQFLENNKNLIYSNGGSNIYR